MKFSLASIVAASCLTYSSAFVVQTPASVGRTSVVLEGSRKAQKIASRTKWLEKRGFAEGVASAGAADAATGLMTNDEGLEYVKLVNPESGASAEVYLLGGVVTSYKDGEGTEFIAVRPDAKMDGSKPISGGLSHCWPQVIDGLFVSRFPVQKCLVLT
jgi:glucose-6-phosphate 1-epimerase